MKGQSLWPLQSSSLWSFQQIRFMGSSVWLAGRILKIDNVWPLRHKTWSTNDMLTFYCPTLNIFMFQVDVEQRHVGWTAFTPHVNVTDIDTRPLLLLTAAHPYVSSLLWSPVLLHAAANKPFVRMVISRRFVAKGRSLASYLLHPCCTIQLTIMLWSNKHWPVPTERQCVCNICPVNMELRFIIRDVCCVALHHIIVWSRESQLLSLCPPTYHTRLPCEASLLCSSVQNPIVVSRR